MSDQPQPPSPSCSLPKPETFEEALAHAINCYSKENGSDTPDFILAAYLVQCLQVFDKTLKWRETWYGRPCGFGKSLMHGKLEEPPKCPVAAPTAAIIPAGIIPTEYNQTFTGQKVFRKIEDRLVVGETPGAGLPITAAENKDPEHDLQGGDLRWVETDHSFHLEQWRWDAANKVMAWFEVKVFRV